MSPSSARLNKNNEESVPENKDKSVLELHKAQEKIWLILIHVSQKFAWYVRKNLIWNRRIFDSETQQTALHPATEKVF